MKLENKAVIIGALWGLVSIIGAISGMIYVYGKQSSVTSSWSLDAVVFLPAFLTWQLTKILPENTIMGLIVLFSPILIGALIGSIIGYAIEKFKQRRSSL